MGKQTTASTPAVSAAPSPGAPRWLRRLGRDCAYVLPGLPLAVVSVAVLGTLTAVSLATVVVWVGAMLMPATLVLAGAFADLSRRRLRTWRELPPVHSDHSSNRSEVRGVAAAFRIMGQLRRWLDLAFETVIAFPLRLVTFAIALACAGLALGGLTHWLWWPWVPVARSWPAHLASWAGWAPSGQVLTVLDTVGNLMLGAVFLATFPVVMRGLARADAALTAALLGASLGTDARADHAGAGLIPHAAAASGRVGPARLLRWAWVGAIYAALALVAVGWPVLSIVHGVPVWLAMLLTMGHGLSLVLAVRWAGAAVGLSTLTVIGTALATTGAAAQAPWPWPVTSLILQCLLVDTLALGHRWIWSVAAWSVSVLVTIGALVLVPGGLPPGSLSNGVVLVSVTAALASLGILGRLWRQGTARAQQAEELGAEETQRRRDLEERNRIARELHDVVAHSMSVINVQASTAQYRKPGIDAEIQQEFDDIARSSHQALSEMRALLDLLRDGEAPTAPVPTLTDIPDLVESARASGATITCTIEQVQAPATVGLTAYRIVQEAISNALRHAPGATIHVRTTVDDDESQLRVVVDNSAPRDQAMPLPGSGLGLPGVRERVGALGGSVRAAPTADGGFELVATLPLRSHAAGADQPQTLRE